MKLRLFLALLLFSSPAFASRDFTQASSQAADINTTFGNDEYSQAFTRSAWVSMKTNQATALFSKEQSSGNFTGWSLQSRNGSVSPQFQLILQADATHVLNVRTTNEFTVNVSRNVIWTYDGTHDVAGVHIYVNGVDQALTTITNSLGANTILNAVTSEIGCRGGNAARGSFTNSILRRVLSYNFVLTASDIAIIAAGTDVPFKSDSTKLKLWQEFGPLNDGATFSADWSGNGNTVFFPNGATAAAYSTTDPTITGLTPYLGLTGGRTLSGPITKVTYNPPFMQNLGWVNGANSGLSGQIGPGYILKTGAGAYSAWLENAHNTKILDPPNQMGMFDNDTPSIYGSSADGLTFTLTSQDASAGSMFNVNNIGLNLTAPQLAAFQALAHAETSIGTVMWDPDDQIWKCWFHAGNNTGPRLIFYATNSVDPATANWQLQNNGLPVLSNGAGGTWEENEVNAPKVVRVSSSRMVMLYSGFNASKVNEQIGQAESTNRGLTWTKNGSNPVITVGAAGTFDDKWLGSASLNFDAPTGLFISWIGTASTLVTANRPTSIEFAYSADGKVWTKGIFGPIANGRDVASSDSATEFIFGASSVDVWFDSGVYKLWYRGDDGVSGAPGFRGRNLGTVNQLLTGGTGGMMMMGVGP